MEHDHFVNIWFSVISKICLQLFQIHTTLKLWLVLTLVPRILCSGCCVEMSSCAISILAWSVFSLLMHSIHSFSLNIKSCACVHVCVLITFKYIKILCIYSIPICACVCEYSPQDHLWRLNRHCKWKKIFLCWDWTYVVVFVKQDNICHMQIFNIDYIFLNFTSVLRCINQISNLLKGKPSPGMLLLFTMQRYLMEED